MENANPFMNITFGPQLTEIHRVESSKIEIFTGDYFVVDKNGNFYLLTDEAVDVYPESTDEDTGMSWEAANLVKQLLSHNHYLELGLDIVDRQGDVQ